MHLNVLCSFLFFPFLKKKNAYCKAKALINKMYCANKTFNARRSVFILKLRPELDLFFPGKLDLVCVSKVKVK